LEQLLKITNPAHCDYEDIQEAIQILQAKTSEINKKRAVADFEQQVDQRGMAKPFHFSNGERFFFFFFFLLIIII